MIKPKELVALAEQARERSYCPYSRFAVGAALLCADGTVFTGCNIENGGRPRGKPRGARVPALRRVPPGAAGVLRR